MLAFTVQVAAGQIVREKPGHLKAENRKSLRADRRADVPYKDSHLAVGKDRLRRGAAPSQPDANEEVDNYSRGRTPNAKGSGLSRGKHKN